MNRSMTTKTMTKTALRNRIMELLSSTHYFDLDRANYEPSFRPFVAGKDGSFTVRRSFFYTHGTRAEDVAAKVENLLGDEFAVTVIHAKEVRKNWPKTSYFEVRFTVTPKVPSRSDG